MKRICGLVVITTALILCLSGIGCAQSGGSADSAITVSATAEAQIPTDSAKITIHIQGDGDSVEQAQEVLSSKEAAIIEALKTAGAQQSDITTVQAEPESVWGGYGEEQVMGGYWDWDGQWVETGYETQYYDRTNEIVGYSIIETITVAELPTTDLVQTLRACASAGAFEFSELGFSVSDREAAYEQALTAAANAAKAKAEVLAKASGVYVGRVVNMVEDSDPTQLVLDVKGEAAKLNPDNIETLDLELPHIAIEAAVTVSYAIS